MKLNVLLPWMLVLGLGTGAAVLYSKNTARDAEIQKLQEQVAEADQLRADVADLQAQLTLREDQVLVSRKDKDELIRLRGEVGTLRDQNQRLTRDMTAAQRQAELAKAEAAQVSQTAQSNSTALAALQASTTQKAESDACIQNLRHLDEAKIQWALENQKPAEAVPTIQDISPYLRTAVACPSGGTYNLNTVGAPTTCSNPAHKLPR